MWKIQIRHRAIEQVRNDINDLEKIHIDLFRATYAVAQLPPSDKSSEGLATIKRANIIISEEFPRQFLITKERANIDIDLELLLDDYYTAVNECSVNQQWNWDLLKEKFSKIKQATI